MIINKIATLAEIETWVEAAVFENDRARNLMRQTLGALNEEVNSMKRFDVDDNGTQYASKEYIAKYDEFQAKQREFQEMHDKDRWLQNKKKELESFENESRRKGLFTSKQEYKIELTLNDLQYLKVPPTSLDPKGPSTDE